MFTGIVKDIGRVIAIKESKNNFILTIGHHLDSVHLGDSISIDGICLTVTNREVQQFQVEVMPETVKRTNIADFTPDEKVNLEPALKPTDEMGGHFVLGHVDTTGKLIQKEIAGNSTLLTFSIAPEYLPDLIEKGSIAINGVSLTLIKVTEQDFQVGIIPYTSKETVLGALSIGQTVNLETDILGKYINQAFQRGDQNDN
ncbi:riboflavin synthase subunit alpha [Companilactobacillus paralimentarius DSM 13238 = JCM 10415]|uniref:Riboflavin synthase n=1 Tax=Companilactobacillus paralimentarius DSM 13238 = JCM 10415 TaxID=1122151 RepID=A0A0R1PGL4_9LACO|nr:riboflavin synthase [Companilactobacillus paralimentarius]KAE9565524.1 riboflavin synthase subunit alpha [Companilactobacillus paralimentarius]KRL28874.1 riboflavin synthase subunit alpha [Companilactobacillus paralimentarius DSM 13238 = JCM 10415]MDR4933835.1 riboflavin synthase [Companilactobacillus paralimentarius]QFR70266.1 riboflavin synthase [Companilactobacillus paralimentarius]